MKTLFNTELNEAVGQFRSTPYTVNGKPGTLPDNVVELDVIYADTLQVGKKEISREWIADIEAKQYREIIHWREYTEQERLDMQVSEAEAQDQQIDPIEIKRIGRKILETETEEVQALHPSMYPTFRGGETVTVGELRTFENVVYRVVQAHTTEYWHKLNEIPALWVRHFADQGTGDSCEGVPVWDSEDHWTSYIVGDRRVDEGKLYECHNTAYGYHKPSGGLGHYGWTFIMDCA